MSFWVIAGIVWLSVGVLTAIYEFFKEYYSKEAGEIMEITPMYILFYILLIVFGFFSPLFMHGDKIYCFLVETTIFKIKKD